MTANNAATYPVRTAEREDALYPVTLTGTGANPPTVSADPGGIIASVSRTGAGDYTLNLADSWRTGQCHADYSSNDTSYAKTHTVDLGGPTDSIGLATVVGGAQADIPVGETVYLLCALAR